MNHFEQLESYLPIDLLEPSAWPLALFVILFFVVFRYFLVAGLLWVLFYVARPTWTKSQQLYSKLPSTKSQLNEIKWSLTTSLLFAAAGVLIGLFWQLGWTKIYLEFDAYPLAYMPLSLILFSLAHEVYFYITHRWLHWPPLFKLAHQVHHQSLTPSPWASFSFHPIEGLIQALPIPLLILIIPIHPMALLVYLSLMTLSAVTNHLGFEVLPKNKWGKFLSHHMVSGLHHAQHHRWYNCNYGLFYTFMDRWFKTEHPSFESEFDHLVAQQQQGAK